MPPPPCATPGAAALEEVAQLRRLRLVSFVEATTLALLLFVAVPLKHAFGWPVATRIMGPVHGIAFIAYIWSVVAMVSGGDWTGREIARLVLAALVPFGGFANAGLLRRKEAAMAAIR